MGFEMCGKKSCKIIIFGGPAGALGNIHIIRLGGILWKCATCKNHKKNENITKYIGFIQLLE